MRAAEGYRSRDVHLSGFPAPSEADPSTTIHLGVKASCLASLRTDCPHTALAGWKASVY